jgi:hypothetical protein
MVRFEAFKEAERTGRIMRVSEEEPELNAVNRKGKSRTKIREADSTESLL